MKSLDKKYDGDIPFSRTLNNTQSRKIPIQSEGDIVKVRQAGKDLGRELDFSQTEMSFVATAVSELARNILDYAIKGMISFHILHQGGRSGIMIIVEDDGPGIVNIELAMTDGYSTLNKLGMGLPGSRRLMDDFELTSEVGKGTKIVMKKWKN